MPKVKNNLRTALVCVVIAIICLFGYLMLQNFCVELFVYWGLETYSASVNLFEHGFWLTFLTVAIVAPVLEELVFRLASCKLLALTKMPVWCVIFISALIFALYHGSWSQLIYQFVMGIWLAWIYIKTNQIGWTMLIHFINNAFIVTYTYFTGTGYAGFNLQVGQIILALFLAVVTTVTVYVLIKKGIPNYEK